MTNYQCCYRYNEDFRGYDQQDAHELLSHLIEWLHDDLNEIRYLYKTVTFYYDTG